MNLQDRNVAFLNLARAPVYRLTRGLAAAKVGIVDLRTAALLRRPLYGQCYDRGDADW